MLIIINIYAKFEENIQHIANGHEKTHPISKTSKVNGTSWPQHQAGQKT